MTKAIPYLLIAALAVGLISLYMLWNNKNETKEQTDILKDQSKVQDDQSTLLIALAKKLMGESPLPVEVVDVKEVPEAKPAAAAPARKLTQQEEDQIIIIADKLSFGKVLTNEEQAFAAIFPDQINKESERSKQTLLSLVKKFGTNTKDFTDAEKDFYQDNQAEVDIIVRDNKLFDSVISKLTTGITDFTEEELQYQKNYPKGIEAELARLKTEAERMKGGAPPNAADERLKLILSFFEDGIPKTVTQLSKMLGEATKTVPSKGNTSNIFGPLVKEGKILCQEASKGKAVYHGLPHWFEKGKLKPEYQEKTQKAKA